MSAVAGAWTVTGNAVHYKHWLGGYRALTRRLLTMSFCVLALSAGMLSQPAQARLEGTRYTLLEPVVFDTAIPLGGVPDSTPSPEEWFRIGGDLQVRNVQQAALIPFLPPRHLSTGDAVVVAPGGAFLGLAFQTEGLDVARALNERGIAAFVLKYRLVETPADFGEFNAGLDSIMGGGTASFRPPADTPDFALADAREALRYLRDNAHRFGIDDTRIGMMGFSAGGFLTLTAATRLPPEERPAFIAPIYPNMAAREVDEFAPPMFLAIARNDFLIADGELGVVHSWLDACRPIEFRLYQDGGHGYGLGLAGTAPQGWIDDFTRWLSIQRKPGAVDVINFNCQ